MAGLPMDSVGLKLVSRFKEKLNKLQPIPPQIVKTGPVFENTMAGGCHRRAQVPRAQSA